jgi:hypothetical protein
MALPAKPPLFGGFRVERIAVVADFANQLAGEDLTDSVLVS